MNRGGCGKTTIFNKLCGTKHEAGWSKCTQTKRLAKHDTICGDQSFTVIDTPRLNTREDTRKYALILRHSLTCMPINAIFVVVEYNPRGHRILDNFEKIARPLM
jgi:hypothetical protein